MKQYLLLIWLSFWQIIGLASTTLQLDQNKIQIHDTFHLILTSDNAQSGGLPNLTPLQNDFTLLGTERSLSYSMINGQTTSHSQWIILLRPKKAGNLVIPAIKVGQEQTKPTSIEVTDEGAPDTSLYSGKSTSDDVMLKTEVSEQNPYVNQQVLYTVRLYNNKQLLNAEYNPPSVENALLIPLGDGRHYQTQINDQTYSVEEQQYAIFPQKSGQLIIHSPSFHAAVYDDFPRQITVQSKETPLSIRATPTDYQGDNWLPAQKITLTETYDPPTPAMKEGDTLTRTVTLQAVAMPAQLLPTLQFKVNKAFSAYPESPEVKNTVKLNSLIGQSTIKVTYLLNQPGNITIPALEVPWFNTLTGKAEIATLPPHTLTIKSNGTSQATAHHSDSKTISRANTSQKSGLKITTPPTQAHAIAWAFIAGIGLALGLVGLIGWFRQTKRYKGTHAHKAAIKRLCRACQKNRAEEARAALLDWAQTQWPEANILNLQDIAQQTRNTTFKQQLIVLTQALYQSNQQSSWQGDGLWQSFHAYLRSKPKNNKTRSDLPPINPC